MGTGMLGNELNETVVQSGTVLDVIEDTIDDVHGEKTCGVMQGVELVMTGIEKDETAGIEECKGHPPHGGRIVKGRDRI